MEKKTEVYKGTKIVRRERPTSTAKRFVDYFVPAINREFTLLRDAKKAIDDRQG
jgi:hypothetical protein